MNDFEMGVYLGEAKTQCAFALAAATRIQENLEVIQAFSEHGDWDRHDFAQRELFRSVHSFLTHASNVAQIFWPIEKKGARGRRRAERGAFLREQVPLTKEFSYIVDRAVRHDLEHFDERLDTWIEERIGIFVQDNIGPVNSMGVNPKNIMRHFDNVTGDFIFRGKVFHTQHVITEVDALYSALSKALE